LADGCCECDVRGVTEDLPGGDSNIYEGQQTEKGGDTKGYLRNKTQHSKHFVTKRIEYFFMLHFQERLLPPLHFISLFRFEVNTLDEQLSKLTTLKVAL